MNSNFETYNTFNTFCCQFECYLIKKILANVIQIQVEITFKDYFRISFP